jgi:hypothetical protein
VKVLRWCSVVNPFQCARVGAGASKSLGFALVTTSDVGLCASTMRLHEDCVLDIRVCMSVSHALFTGASTWAVPL